MLLPNFKLNTMADAQATLDAPLKKAIGAKEITVDGENVIEGSKEHQALTQVFDTEKKYMFELAEESDQNLHPVILSTNAGRNNQVVPARKHKPFHNIILSSQIVWKGQRRNIRYYDGCTTLFVDKQPQDKDLVAQLISQTKQQRFIDGKAGWNGYEKMLLMYMNMCSWNTESPFRTKTANGIFKPINADQIANEKVSRIDQMEEALKLSKEATETKMMIHAAYLGIPTTDWDSGNDLTEKEIRALYRERAMSHPKEFIDSFGNKSIEVKYYIDKALETGTISNKFNPNKATWGSKNTVICDISGLKTHEAISQKIFEFSQSEDGAEFLVQLKALYN